MSKGGKRVIAVFCAIVLLVIGWLVGWAVTGQMNPVQWVKQPEPNDENNVLITEGGSNGVQLRSAAIAVADFEAYGLDEEETETAYTLTITKSPADSVTTRFTWSAEFVNPASSWANGKTVTDYLTVTPAKDNSSAVVACKQAFGEQIRVKVVYNDDSTIFATRMADYVKRVTGYELSGAAVLYNMVDDSSNCFDPVLVDGTFTYGVGTVQGTFDYAHCLLSAHIELSDEAYNYLLSADSEAYEYMSQFLAANNNIELSKQSTTQIYKYNNNDPYYEWYEDYSCFSFLNKPFGEINGKNYYYAAFRKMLENTTNQARLVLNVTYKYGTSYTEELELKCSWETTPASHIVLINGIGIDGSELIF